MGKTKTVECWRCSGDGALGDGTLGPFATFGAFRTRRGQPYEGERYAGAFWEYDLTTVPFEWLGLRPLVVRRTGLARLLMGSVAENILRTAGVNRRIFYRHFASKHDLLFADYDAGLHWFRRALAARFPADSPG